MTTLPSFPSTISYYLVVNGKQEGPYTEQEIRNALAKDSYVLKLLAWKKGMPDWQPLSTFQEFVNTDAKNCPPPIPQ